MLFRSLRGAPDREIAQFGGGGFHVAVEAVASGAGDIIGRVRLNGAF